MPARTPKRSQSLQPQRREQQMRRGEEEQQVAVPNLGVAVTPIVLNPRLLKSLMQR